MGIHYSQPKTVEVNKSQRQGTANSHSPPTLRNLNYTQNAEYSVDVNGINVPAEMNCIYNHSVADNSTESLQQVKPHPDDPFPMELSDSQIPMPFGVAINLNSRKFDHLDYKTSSGVMRSSAQRSSARSFSKPNMVDKKQITLTRNSLSGENLNVIKQIDYDSRIYKDKNKDDVETMQQSQYQDSEHKDRTPLDLALPSNQLIAAVNSNGIAATNVKQNEIPQTEQLKNNGADSKFKHKHHKLPEASQPI